MAEPPVSAGEVVSGKYRIDRVIGSGSMGFVVAGWHLELDQPVAIKLLNPDLFEREEAAQRFRREVRAAARVKSEHVARVLDVGALASGVPFMVMELLQGNNLEEELIERGVLPVEEAVSYLLETVEALAEAHAAGIIHRDLKPANLFVARRADRSRLVKVLDFGISKSLLDSHTKGDMSLTGAGVVIGSPLYMSPEQMRSTKDADYRSDIWSLGAILYQLVTGSPPYPGDTLPEICAQVYAGPPPAPSTLAKSLPPELDRVILRALARDPAERYQTVAEFGAALADFSPSSRVHAERARRVLAVKSGGSPSSEWPRALTGGGEAPTIAASVDTVLAWPQTLRERALRWGVAALLGAGLVGLGVYGARRTQRAETPARAAQPSPSAAPVPAAPEPAPLPEPAAEERALPLAPQAASAPSAPSPPPVSASGGAASVPVQSARPPKRPRPRSVDNGETISDFGGRH
jgi:eukaryotic-like serine/threonine-protein kinase